MKVLQTLVIFMLFFAAAPYPGHSQPASTPTLAVLPFYSIGIDENNVESAEIILQHELNKLDNFHLITVDKVLQKYEGHFCKEVPCAIELGKGLQADEVLLCKLMTLGEKIVVQYTHISVPDERIILLDQITSKSLEDLDTVMKRLAMSIAQNKKAEEVAEVGVITESEELSPRRRGSRKFGGFSFGYLYPQHGYDNADRSFSMDFRTGAEIGDYAIGMQTAIRKGFAVNVFGSYLFSRKDFCPYLGGGFGFHWVSHEQPEIYYTNNNYGQELDEKKGDGFELVANGGIIAFRTYNIQIIVNLAYTYTLNDFDDRGVVFTIGLLK